MATSSILGGAKPPKEISGKDMQALGPSDNSDSGSDAVGAYSDDELSGDSDAAGTGERASAGGANQHGDADILPDRIDRAPGLDADSDLDNDAGDDFNNLGEVEQLADDSDDPDGELDDIDVEGAPGGRL